MGKKTNHEYLFVTINILFTLSKNIKIDYNILSLLKGGEGRLVPFLFNLLFIRPLVKKRGYISNVKG